jgi:hypothetical protein
LRSEEAERSAYDVSEMTAVEEQQVLEPVCRHHWRIETPRGATSQGVCKVCGATKEFRNSVESYWDNDGGLENSYSRWGRTRVISRPASSKFDDSI